MDMEDDRFYWGCFLAIKQCFMLIVKWIVSIISFSRRHYDAKVWDEFSYLPNVAHAAGGWHRSFVMMLLKHYHFVGILYFVLLLGRAFINKYNYLKIGPYFLFTLYINWLKFLLGSFSFFVVVEILWPEIFSSPFLFNPVFYYCLCSLNVNIYNEDTQTESIY